MATETQPPTQAEPIPASACSTEPAPQTTDGTFTLLLFANASTYTDAETLTFPAPMTLATLFDALEHRFPGFKEKVLRSAAVTVNLEYVDFELPGEGHGGVGGEITLRKGDEVGVIPPVSSG